MQLFDTETPRCCENVVSCKFKELEKISATNWDKLDKENVSNLWNCTVLAAATKCLMSKRQSLTMFMMVLFFNATIAKYGGRSSCNFNVMKTDMIHAAVHNSVTLWLPEVSKVVERGPLKKNFRIWYQKQQILGHACIKEHK